MLVIRLLRVGKKNQPSFKIVVTEKQNPPRGGRFVEEVGNYNPVTKEKGLKQERIKYWVSQGAQPSNTVHNLLVKEGILEEKKIPVHKKSKKLEEDKSSSLPLPSKEGSEKEEIAPAKETSKEEEKEEAPKDEKSEEKVKEVLPQSPESPKEKVKEVKPQSEKKGP